MKRFFKFILLGLGLIYIRGYSQCNDIINGNINDNINICGFYGDANGNSNWDWELTDNTNPNYCKMWYARTSPNVQTFMKSPFVNPSFGALDAISQNRDFTRDKGWELLRRDFGCSGERAYPYFVLYNKYTGLTRVYIYQPGTSPEYSGFLLQVRTTASPSYGRYPATISGGDSVITAPDKYLNPEQNSNLANTMFVVGETGGRTNWSVAEFNAGFDPNIEHSYYTGSGLEITIYGVTNSALTANITGTSTTSGTPVSNISYMPRNTTGQATPDNGKKFTATGEKFVKFSKTVVEVRDGIHKSADNIYNSLANISSTTSVKGRIKSTAKAVSDITSSTGDLGKLLGQLSSALGAAGQVLNFVGGVIGLFGGGGDGKPVAAPTYTSYNLELRGDITTKVISGSFLLRVPGTIQNNADNPTYYRCPLGIFNIKNTPEADSVGYIRPTVFQTEVFASPDGLPIKHESFASYRLRNNLVVSFNSGAGLELVSAKAAIVGEVLPNGNQTAAAYDLLEDYSRETVFVHIGTGPAQVRYNNTYNYMLPDLQAGILEVTNYDPQKNLHTFQTPYYDIGCLNGLAFNARAETKIYLRVKAILKKKNDPSNTPIYYIQDYKIKVVEGQMDGNLRDNLKNVNSRQYLPPYSNATDVPSYTVVDKVISNRIYNSFWDETADNSITTQSSVVVTSGQSVGFKAGSEINLEDGFETEDNVEFEAMLRNSQLNISCSAPSIEAFIATLNGGNCYNTGIRGMRQATNPDNAESVNASEEVKVYPTPTNGNLVISGINNSNNAVITILDQSGRTIREIRSASYEASGRIDLDVSALTNGVYFVKIQTLTQTITKKIVVSK
jgi:hypothetical protein